MRRVNTNPVVFFVMVTFAACGNLEQSLENQRLLSREDPSFEVCEPNFGRAGDLYAYAETTDEGNRVVASWTDSLGDSSMWLEIEVYQNVGEGVSSPGTYPFTPQEASYQTCSLCVIAWSERWTENGWEEKSYMPVADTGAAEITQLSILNDPIGKPFSGSFDVVMQEVVIDPNTWLTTPVENGCSGRLTFRWSDTVQETQETTCTSEPVADSMQECSACFGQGGFSESVSGDWQDGGGFIVYHSWVNSRIYPTQWLNIESYTSLGGPQQPGTYVFTEQDASYADCALCVVAYVEVETDSGFEEKAFMPVGKDCGQAVITAIDVNPIPSGNFAGELDVKMQEVSIDYETWETKPVTGGCSGVLHFVWDSPIECFFCADSDQENCSNNIDDDGDALVDCQDDDCNNDQVCQTIKENCSNNIDDDGDGLVDCQDDDCNNDQVCQTIEENCSNKVDDDGDGLVDCQDNDCLDDTTCQVVPENCINKIDDDGDGRIDCLDNDCRNHSNCRDSKDKGCGVGGSQPWWGLVVMVLGLQCLRRRRREQPGLPR